ncbi:MULTISPECIES: CBS domain-containing protein [unclassified Paenibacillus]|uniref:CBS domain-containing protein n=1 Tax=unclassified Paenibacillus TaxID=185978 RepID=UPI002404B844|nr:MULTISPECIES: CBS domain-containing protein [unclassified Paenibacillus]MDF9842880.1 CBS domain-containing protein [Paenibacillus sp. PastF-2]MDF9849468.1 CBS domain-containing protein [Paenibacillus sp. PastM-2]MDF9856157.1 CBS domain-containing protein [Paenibacillus sp. PastF-1]MDH6481311.1 CBS domain-containing protein [Paenibacillus sp. PastH-2]MDH6508845.1 CBS domain-containing protein [Paenibacillus sp. PastM-3]
MKTVREVMTSQPAAVTLLDNVYEVAVKMRDYDTGFIPVVDSEAGGKLIGVITDRDLVLRGYAEKHPGSSSVETVMSSKVISIEETATVDEAAELMASEQIRRLPVTRGGKLIGVVSLGDLAVKRIFADEAGEALSEISQRQLH